MALFDYTLDELVERVCKLLLHDWTEGTATAGGADYLTDSSRIEQADYWNDQEAYIYIRSGTAAGDWRKIDDFGASAGKIEVTPNFSNSIAVGTTYSLHIEFTRDEVKEAINAAIDMVAEEALVWKIDETTITLVADQYEYDLPSDMVILCRVTMADSDGYFYYPGNIIDPNSYRIIHSIPAKLHFDQIDGDSEYSGHEYEQLWQPTADRKLRLEGFGSQDALASDSETCALSPAYVTYQAAAILHASRIRRPENEPDDHRTQAQVCQAKADIERARVVKVQLPPNSKRIKE